MLQLLVLSMALADTAPDTTPAPERAPTVRQPSERSTFFSASAPTLAMGLGGAYGAYAVSATTYAVQGEDLTAMVVPLALGGAGVGALVGYLATSDGAVTDTDVLRVGSTTAWGGLAGYEVGRALIAPDAEAERQRVQAVGVLGTMAGLGVGVLTQGWDLSADEIVRADLGVGFGFLAGTAWNDLRGLDVSEDRQRRAPLTLATSAAMGGLALGAAGSGLRQPDLGVTALTVGHAGWIGGWTPMVLGAEGGSGRSAAGARLGLGAGYALSYGVAALGEPSPSSLMLQGAGFGVGSLLGLGLPLGRRGEDGSARAVIGSMLVGGVVGQVAGAALAPSYELGEGDVAWMGSMATWTAWQSAGWGAYAGARSGDGARGIGTALTVGGLAGTAVVLSAPAVELSPEGSLLMFSAGGWGSVLGAMGGYAAGLERPQTLALSLTAGDLALAGAGLAAASRDPSGSTVARVNGGLAVGGLLGALATSAVAPPAGDYRRAAAGTIVGSGLGLTAALLLPERERASAGLALPSLGLSRLPVETSWSVSPWMAEDGSQGASVSLHGVIEPAL